ncbi:hypothetical protein OHV71_11230 [Acinetobacter baumannii]|nr:hypothetical protein [Acinetobacter baumannii]
MVTGSNPVYAANLVISSSCTHGPKCHTPTEHRCQIFDVLAFESGRVKVTHTKDKKGVHESIQVKLSCGFAKFEMNNQKYEFVFNYQIQEINKDFFTSAKEKLAK